MTLVHKQDYNMQEANLLKGKKKPAYTLLMHCEGVQGGKVYTEDRKSVV